MTTKTEVFTFDELSDEAKEQVVQDYAIDGLIYDWWEYVYEDAKNIGLEITSFDEHNIEGNFTTNANKVMRNIIADHGANCETAKTVKEFYRDKHAGGINSLEDELLHALLEDYRVMLWKEYEYLTSQAVDNYVKKHNARCEAARGE